MTWIQIACSPPWPDVDWGSGHAKARRSVNVYAKEKKAARRYGKFAAINGGRVPAWHWLPSLRGSRAIASNGLLHGPVRPARKKSKCRLH